MEILSKDSEIKDSEIAELKFLMNKIYNEIGFDCRHYPVRFIQRRIMTRMMACKVNSYLDYFNILNENKNEWKELVDALTINVTQFFRDSSVWEALQNRVLPEIIQKKNNSDNKIIKIWSAGCSSGEEPYSISILLKETLPDIFFYTIYASDIDEDALIKAKEGIYNIRSLINIDRERFTKYFTRHDKDTYKISDEIKRKVIFLKHDIFEKTSFLLGLDIIFCRNVMIYFTPEKKEEALEIFYNSLNDMGLLVLGKCEVIVTKKGVEMFSLYDLKEHIYVKKIN